MKIQEYVLEVSNVCDLKNNSGTVGFGGGLPSSFAQNGPGAAASQGGPTAGGTVGVPSSGGAKRKEIYKYEAPWQVYSMNWSVRPDKRFRLAIGSFVEE